MESLQRDENLDSLSGLLPGYISHGLHSATVQPEVSVPLPATSAPQPAAPSPEEAERMAFASRFTEDVASFHVGTFIGGGKQPASGHPNTKLGASSIPSHIKVFLKDIEADAELIVRNLSPSSLSLLIYYSH